MSLKRRLDKLDMQEKPTRWEVWQVDTSRPDTYIGPEGQTLTEREFRHYEKTLPSAVTVFLVRQTVI